MLKKTLLLAFTAMAVLALPAMASASGTWTDAGVPVTAETTVTATGQIGFTSESGAGGIECATAHVAITVTANQAATHITKFECTGAQTFGALKDVFGCKVEAIHTAVPFNGTPTATNIEINEIGIVNTMNAGCLVGEEIIVSDGVEEPVTATPDNTEEISSVEMGGEVETNVGPSTVEGNLAVTPAGTYGIE